MNNRKIPYKQNIYVPPLNIIWPEEGWLSIDAIKIDRFLQRFNICVSEMGMNAQYVFESASETFALNGDENQMVRMYIRENHHISIL